MTKQMKADIALLLITIGWGSSFILSKLVINEIQPYNFLAIRFIIASFISGTIFFKKIIRVDKNTLIKGSALGFLLFLHYATQTVGLQYTTASKSAFITGINVILVPIFSAWVLKNRPDRSSVIGALIAMLGMGLLSFSTVEANTGINIGDVYTLVCAIIFAVYIIAVGKYTKELDSVVFAIVQIFVVGILSLGMSLLTETPVLPTTRLSWVSIIVLSVVCTSAAYIVQNVAQQYTSSTHTALIYTGEPVFAAMFGYLFFREVLNMQGTIGALMIVSGMLAAELDIAKFFKRGGSDVEKSELSLE